eukprot:1678981-Amphidinium_carterae.1
MQNPAAALAVSLWLATSVDKSVKVLASSLLQCLVQELDANSRPEQSQVTIPVGETLGPKSGSDKMKGAFDKQFADKGAAYAKEVRSQALSISTMKDNSQVQLQSYNFIHDTVPTQIIT